MVSHSASMSHNERSMEASKEHLLINANPLLFLEIADMEHMFMASNQLVDNATHSKNDNGFDLREGPTDLLKVSVRETTEMNTPTILIDSCCDDNVVGGRDRDSDDAKETQDVDTGGDHCRLLRLLSNSSDECNSAVTAVQDIEAFLPASPCCPDGTRLRLRSRRAKDRIPSRFFRSLQNEFDSSTEDVSAPVLSSSDQRDQTVFRSPHLNASLTPDTPSSATSELEGFIFTPVAFPNLHLKTDFFAP